MATGGWSLPDQGPDRAGHAAGRADGPARPAGAGHPADRPEAAVIGRIFQERVLERLADDVAVLESELEHLEREELIGSCVAIPSWNTSSSTRWEVAYETASPRSAAISTRG